MRRDVRLALADVVADDAHLLIVERRVKRHEHVVRVLLREVHAHGKQLLAQHWVAQQIAPLPRERLHAVVRRSVRGGDHVPIARIHAHALELLRVHRRALARVVGQKARRAARALQRRKEVKRAVDQAVAEVERAVHVQQKAADRGQPRPNFFLCHLKTLLCQTFLVRTLCTLACSDRWLTMSV